MSTALKPAKRNRWQRGLIAAAFSTLLLSLAVLIGGMAAIEFRNSAECSVEIQAKVWQGTIAAQADCGSVPRSQPTQRTFSLKPKKVMLAPARQRTTDRLFGRATIA